MTKHKLSNDNENGLENSKNFLKQVSKIWGKEEWIVNRDYCGKKLTLNKGFRCSMHYHKNKDETFYILKGKVLMETDKETKIMAEEDSILIEPNTKHRFTGLENSEIMEFSTHHEDEDSYRTELSGEIDLSEIKLPNTKTTCLVTGGAGFIGSNLALELEKQGYEVIVADNLLTGTKDNLKGFKGKFLNIDISKDFKIEEHLDIIFHEAAITDPRFKDDDEMLRANLEGFKNIINLAKKNNAKLVYASTANLYGNKKTPMEEEQEKELISTYGKSKLEMDNIAKQLHDKMHIVGLRYFNVFGPGESFKGRAASMIYHLSNQMKENKHPRIFKHGEQKRDHIYVKDVVTATIKAAQAPSGIYNVGTGIATNFNELIKILNEVLNTSLEPEYFDSPYNMKSYQSDTQADITLAEKQLKFKAQYDLKKGIKDYMEYLKNEH
jgi:ADP-L-glycero-D-manno-heptose 6-epimerase